MANRIPHKLFALLFLLGGVWACFAANLWIWAMPGGWEQDLAVPASLAALVTVAAEALWFFQPRLGIALAIATMIPQPFSFAHGSVAYAFHLWPNYRIELDIIGSRDNLANVFVHDFSFVPQYMLRTDADYVGFGLGLELVSFLALLVLLHLFALSRRPLSTGLPN